MTNRILPVFFLLLAASVFAEKPALDSFSESYQSFADLEIRMTLDEEQIISGGILDVCVTIGPEGSWFNRRFGFGIAAYTWEFPITKAYFLWSLIDIKTQFGLIGFDIREGKSRFDNYLYLDLAWLRFRKTNGNTLWYPGVIFGNRTGIGFIPFAVQFDIRYTYNFRQESFFSIDSLSFGLEIVAGGGKQNPGPWGL